MLPGQLCTAAVYFYDHISRTINHTDYSCSDYAFYGCIQIRERVRDSVDTYDITLAVHTCVHTPVHASRVTANAHGCVRPLACVL